MATATKLPRNFKERANKLSTKGKSEAIIAAELNVTRWQVRKALGRV